MNSECSNVDIRRPTVCLVDDDPMVRNLFKRVIQRTGCHVITASGAIDAIELLAEHQVHMVLSDLRMPEIADGEFLLENISQNYPNLPVCMMSGDWCSEIKGRLISSGAIACIIKPFSADTFERILETTHWQTDEIKHNTPASL